MYRYRYICVVQSCISGHEGWMTQTWFRLLNFHNLFWSDTKNWLRVFCVNLVSKGAIIFEMIRLKKIFHILLCFFFGFTFRINIKFNSFVKRSRAVYFILNHNWLCQLLFLSNCFVSEFWLVFVCVLFFSLNSWRSTKSIVIIKMWFY